MQGDTCVLSTNGHLHTFDGVRWVDNAVTTTLPISYAAINVGSVPRRSGRFTLTDGTIAPSSKVMIQLGVGPYAGKGTRADEAEMYPGIIFTAVPGTGIATVYWAAPYGSAVRGNLNVEYQVDGAGSVISSQTVNLGSTPKRSGSFVLTDALISVNSHVVIQLAAGPYTGKGTLADEAVMYPGLTFVAVPAAGTATVYWASPIGGIVRGNVQINYRVG